MFILMLLALLCGLVSISAIQMFFGVKSENVVLVFGFKVLWYSIIGFFCFLKKNAEKIGFALTGLIFGAMFVLMLMLIFAKN